MFETAAETPPGPTSPGPTSPGPTPPGSPPRQQHPGQEFFDRIRSFGMVRPDDGRWAAGVCAGIARKLDIDPLLVRAIFVALAVVGGFGVGLYGLVWLFLPHPDGRIHAEGVLRGVVTAGFVGSVICILSDLGWSNGHWPFARFWWPWGPPGGLLLTALIVLGVWWLLTRGRSGPAGPGRPTWPAPPANPGPTGPGAPSPQVPAPDYGAPRTATSPGGGTASGYGPGGGTASGYGPGSGYGQTSGFSPGSGFTAPPAPAPVTVRPPRPVDLHAPSHALTRSVLGLALVAAAVTVLVYRLVGTAPGHAAVVAIAIALGVVALGVVAAGLLGRRSGGLAPIAVILAIVAVNGAILDSTAFPLGERTWRPTSPTVAEQGYDVGAADATVDLTDPGLVSGRSPADPVTLAVHVGFGRLHLLLPASTTVEVHASVGAGNLTDRVNDNGSAASGNSAGAGLDRVVQSGSGLPVIVIDAQVGFGDLKVDTNAGGTS